MTPVRARHPAVIAAGVVVGALTSPFVAVYTVLLGIPAAALAWAIGERRGTDRATSSRPPCSGS